MKLQKAFLVALAFVFLVSFSGAISGIDKHNGAAATGDALGTQFIEKFMLVNADTDTVIGELADGDNVDPTALGTTNFNVIAVTNPATVGSVQFRLDQTAPRIENQLEYTLGGDDGNHHYNPVTFTAGDHTLTATPSAKPRFTGLIGASKLVRFSVGSGAPAPHNDGATPSTGTTPPVTGTTPTDDDHPTSPIQNVLATTALTLVNAETDQDIMAIEDNMTIDIAEVGSSLSVRADTTAIPEAKSVKFGLNDTANYRVENLWPFTLNADSNGNYQPWSYEVGKTYTVTATPYPKTRATGTPGTALTRTFTIIDSDAPVSNGRSSDSTPQGDLLPSGTNAVAVSAPLVGATVVPGATIPMTCDIGTAAGATVWQLTYAWYQIVGGTTNAATFINQNPVSYTTGSYTQNVTVPASAAAGTFTFQCVAYFNTSGTYTQASAVADVTIASTPPPAGLTTSVAISAPANNANILDTANFTLTATGTPTSDQITKVDFYYVHGNGETLIATDSSGPTFSLTNANLNDIRGYNCPNIYAKATLATGATLTSPIVFVIVTDTAATNPIATCPATPLPTTTFRVTAPVHNSQVNAGETFTVSAVANAISGATVDKVVFYHLGGNAIANGVYTITTIATDQDAPYSATYSIANPGNFGYPGGGLTDHIRAVAFYSNGRTSTSQTSIKVNASITLPNLASAQIVNGSGAVLATMSSGMTVNIGTQGGGFGSAISVKANAGNVAPTSVKFDLTGPAGFTAYTHCESSSPYSLYGDAGSTYTTWPGTIILGAYTLTVTPYNAANCTGAAGTAITNPFIMANNDDTTPPSVPTGVTVTYRDSDEVRLSWTASTGSPTAYKVYRTPGGVATLGNVTTLTDTTAAGGTNYSYTVSAVDAVGNESGVSSAVNAPALSTAFSLGGIVDTTGVADVKNAPDGTVSGQQAAGKSGTITETAAYYQGTQYWKVDFTTTPTTPDGWVQESKLTTHSVSPQTAPVLYTPKKSFDPNEVAIIINSDNSVSSSIGNAYKTARGIPTANVITVALGNSSFVTASTFNTVRTSILSQLPSGVQAIAFAGEKPFVVRNNTTDTCTSGAHTCMSITAALAMGYSTSHTTNASSGGTSTQTATSYYLSDSLTPRTSYSFIPTMMLAGRTASEGQTFINQGLAADNTYPNPSGSVFAIQTTDHNRSDARRSDMSTIVPGLFIAGNQPVSNYIDNYCAYTGCGDYQYGGYTGNYITGQTVIAYHTGADWVPSINTNTIKPGAVGEHVTSFGGYLQDSSTSNDGSTYRKNDVDQMPITQWLQYGFVASAGTVQEPWCGGCSYGGLADKFPIVSEFWKRYYTGTPALQAYASVIKRPGQTLLVGDPLANPWKTPQATFSGTTLTINTTQLAPSKTYKLQKNVSGTWTDISGFTNIQSPSNGTKYGLKTITYPIASSTECYRLIDSSAPNATTVQIPVSGIMATPSCTGGSNPPDTNAPTAPSGLAISGTPTQTSIALNWSDSTGDPVGESVFYKVYRSATSGGTYTQIATGLTTSDYSDTGLTAGTTYWYKVASYDAASNTSAQTPSAGVSGTTAAAADTSAPNVPTGLAVTGVTSSSASLSWTATTDNGGGTVAGYKIFRSSTSTGTYSQVGTSATTSYTDGALSASTTYYYKVSAYDNATTPNESAQSGSVSATTSAASGGSSVMGINGSVGPNNTEDVNPTDASNDYYVACQTGSDTAAGTTQAGAWKTLTKLNQSASLSAGSKIYFKRGETCRGTINAYTSGTSTNPIQYLAYGSGTAPVISGAELVTTAWTVYSGNIWKTTLPTDLNPKYVFVGDTIQTLARHPNTGFLMTDSTNGSSITDSPIGTAPLTSLSGGNVVFRSSPWSWEKEVISSQSGTTINYPATSYATPLSNGSWEDTGWGYLVENKLGLLDSAGEWFYNQPTKELYFWAPGNANPNTLTIGLSTYDTGFSPGWQRTDVKVKNLIFEGYKAPAVFGGSGDGNMKRVTVENVEIRNSDVALKMYTTNGNPTTDANTIKNNYIHDTYNEGIYLQGGAGHLVEGNVLENIGNDAQRGANTGGWNLFGFRAVDSGSNYTVRRNIIKNTGYIGAVLGGSGLFEENIVENADDILNDGGGIAFDYTNGLTIRKNIIRDISYDMSTMPPLYTGYEKIANGIYFGDHSIVNTAVDANVIVNVGSSGIWMDHSGGYTGNSVTNNIINNTGLYGIGASDYSVYNSCNAGGACYVAQFDDVVSGNKVYGIDANQIPMYQLFRWNSGSSHTDFGNWNNNYYYNPYRTNKIQSWFVAQSLTSNYTLPQWQALPDGNNDDVGTTASSYTLTNPSLAAQVFYNATPSAISVDIGSGGCTAAGAVMNATQTIPSFGAVVVEHGNC